MKNLVRMTVASLVLMLMTLPTLAQDTVTLKPYTDKAYGISSVAPEGWQDAGRGIYRRAKSASDITLMAQQSAPLAPDKLLTALLPQLGLKESPTAIGGYQSPVLAWTLYKIDVKAPTGTIVVDLALAPDEASGKTYLVLLQTTPDEFDALYKSVFQPTLEAFTPYVEPTTSAPAPYVEEEVTFKNGDVTLAGTLTIPEGDGPFPAIVLVTGSGPQDRDESLAPLAAIKPFRLIADDLTRKGMAVLRYDDRGTAKSTGDFATATTADFAKDASAAINFLLTRKEINPDQVGLLGHSEGGVVAAMLGATNKHLAFIIAMAGPAVSGEDVIIQQNKRVSEAENASADAIKTQLEFLPKLFAAIQAKDSEAIRQLAHDAALAQAKLMPEDQQKKLGDLETYANQQADAVAATYNSDWWRLFLSYNPGDDWAKTTIPVLAIYGTFDVQVDSDQNAPAFEAAMKKAANTDYQVTVIPKANHLMQAATTGSPSEYGTIKQEFTPDFLTTITDWLTKHHFLKSA